MENLMAVVAERDEAYHMLEEGDDGANRRTEVVRNAVGMQCFFLTSLGMRLGTSNKEFFRERSLCCCFYFIGNGAEALEFGNVCWKEA